MLLQLHSALPTSPVNGAGLIARGTLTLAVAAELAGPREVMNRDYIVWVTVGAHLPGVWAGGKVERKAATAGGQDGVHYLGESSSGF